MSYRRHLLPYVALAAFALAIGACTDAAPAPTMPGRPSLSAVKFWEAGSSVAWNRTARELVAARAVNDATFKDPARLMRIFTYLSIAQYNAVLAAEDARQRGTHPSPATAAAGASLVILESFFGHIKGMEQLLEAVGRRGAAENDDAMAEDDRGAWGHGDVERLLALGEDLLAHRVGGEQAVAASVPVGREARIPWVIQDRQRIEGEDTCAIESYEPV